MSVLEFSKLCLYVYGYMMWYQYKNLEYPVYKMPHFRAS
jgi:hypothetical protein